VRPRLLPIISSVRLTRLLQLFLAVAVEAVAFLEGTDGKPLVEVFADPEDDNDYAARAVSPRWLFSLDGVTAG